MSAQGSRTSLRFDVSTLVVVLGVLLVWVDGAAGAGSLSSANVSAPANPGGASCGFLTGQPGVAGVDVASNDRGDTIVSWTRNNGAGGQVVQAAFRPAGGSFGAPQSIGATFPCYFLGLLGPTPDVAIDRNGGGVIVFPAAGNGGRTVIRASLKSPSGSFAPPVDVSNDVQAANTDPHVAMNGAGIAVAVWTRSNGANTVVETSTRSPGGTFTGAQPLSTAGQNASSARVALNDAGATAVTWVRSNGTVNVAQTRVRPAGAGAYAAVQDLSAAGAAGQDASTPDVALDPSGRATVVWSRSDGTRTLVESRFLTPAGVIGAGVDQVSSLADNGTNPNLAVDAGNTAVVVFGACPTAGGSCAVNASARASNSSFASDQTISPPSDNSVQPRVVIDKAGVATAVLSPFTSNARILMTRRPPNGNFGGVVPISPETGTAFFPALAADDEGNVVTAWTYTSPTAPNPQVAQFSAFDAGAPRLSGVAVPGTGTVGQGVGMAAAATDRWTPVSLKWTFGDGGSASGGAVTHAFGSAGAFTVTVTATDAVGNASKATRSIVVNPAPPPPPPPPTPRITSPVRVTWGVSGKQIFLLRLQVSKVPKGSKAELRCSRRKSKKCPFKRVRSKKRRNGTITMFKEVKTSKVRGMRKRSFRAGQRLELRVTREGYIGKVVRYELKKSKIPSGKVLCLPIGTKKPRPRC